MEQVCAEVLAGIHHVHAQGSTLMEQLFDLIVFGDLLTLEAAFEAGVDPGPVPILNDIKAELARTTL